MTPEERQVNRLARELMESDVLRQQVIAGLRNSMLGGEPIMSWAKDVQQVARRMKVPYDEMLQAVIERAIHLSRDEATDS